jgi:hypothetical protein
MAREWEGGQDDHHGTTPTSHYSQMILRNSTNDEKLADKFDLISKPKLESAANKTTSWFDASQEASKEEYKLKQKEPEAIVK